MAKLGRWIVYVYGMTIRWFIVRDENDKVIHETYDEQEAQSIADIENGYVVETTRVMDAEGNVR